MNIWKINTFNAKIFLNMLNDYLCLFTSLLYKYLYNFTTIVAYELKNHHVAEVQTEL